VHCFCRDPAIVEQMEALGVPASVGRIGGQIALHDAVLLAARLRRLAPDAFLITTFKKVWLAGLAATLARVPVVVSRVGLSTDLPDRNRAYRDGIQRFVDAVVVNSDAMRAPFARGVPGFDTTRIVTIYNGVAGDFPGDARKLRRELNFPEGAPVLGAVARLSGQKRIDRMLRVLSQIPEAVLVLAGDGEDRASLESIARDLGVAGRVHFLGHREDIADVLAAFDVFLLTSDREGMANSMLEALAAGVPVVSTPVSGAEEALQPLADGRVPGLVVDSDEDALSAAIQTLLMDPARRASMSEAARERARTMFSFEQKLDAWEQIFAGDHPARVHEGPRED
jgi:glycosyltransferase involved in cell wall biosynthesis